MLDHLHHPSLLSLLTKIIFGNGSQSLSVYSVPTNWFEERDVCSAQHTAVSNNHYFLLRPPPSHFYIPV